MVIIQVLLYTKQGKTYHHVFHAIDNYNVQIMIKYTTH